MHATTYVAIHILRGDRIDLAGVPLSRALPRPSEYFAYKKGIQEIQCVVALTTLYLPVLHAYWNSPVTTAYPAAMR